MEIHADSKGKVVEWINIGHSKGFYRGFGNSPKIRRLADPVPLAFNLLTLKFITFDRMSRTTMYQVSSQFDQGFSFYHANIRIHIVIVIAISPPTNYIISADNDTNVSCVVDYK